MLTETQLDAQRDDPDEDNDEEEPENAQVAAPKKVRSRSACSSTDL